MIPHRDEILRPAVSTDATAVPRYNLVGPNGTIIEKNVAMRLSNPVAREGTPISKAALDEMLAASGVTAGTATAYTLAQDEYTLFDGAPVRLRLHTASGDGATLNINGTGAKPLRDMMGAAMPGGIPAGTWLAAYYSAAAGAYVLAGGEAVRALYGERYTVDDAVAYVKDVPEDALTHAEIGEVGGMTYKVNVGTEANPVYELRSAAGAYVESLGVNLAQVNTVPFPVTKEKTVIFEGKISGDFVLSWKHNLTGIVNASALLVRCTCDDGSYIDDVAIANSKGIIKIVGKTVTQIAVFNWCGATGGSVYDIMLNRGTTAQPYTPYFRDTLPIPEAVRALDGYGWGYSATVRNYIDMKNRKFVKMFGRVDLGTLNWAVQNTNRFITNSLNPVTKPYQTDATGVGLCSLYDVVSWTSVNSFKKDKTFALHNTGIYVADSAYTDAASFKAAMSGVMLYYELAEPIITDISDILTADNFLHIEAGGTITAVNEYGYAVPTKITYQHDVLANRASIFALEKLRLAMELLAKADLSNVSGTFGGVVKANAAAVSALGTAQVRNVTISSTDLSAGSASLATGSSYHVYS